MSAEATLFYPSRWRRFVCMMYEAVLIFGLSFGILLIFDVLTKSQHALHLRFARQAILFMAIGLYFLLSWRRTGQTLPMQTLHLRLQTLSGQRLSWWRALYRYVLACALPLSYSFAVYALSHLTQYQSTTLFIVFAPLSLFIWTWFDKDKLFLHDRLAGTRIIDTRPHLQ